MRFIIEITLAVTLLLLSIVAVCYTAIIATGAIK